MKKSTKRCIAYPNSDWILFSISCYMYFCFCFFPIFFPLSFGVHLLLSYYFLLLLVLCVLCMCAHRFQFSSPTNRYNGCNALYVDLWYHVIILCCLSVLMFILVVVPIKFTAYIYKPKSRSDYRFFSLFVVVAFAIFRIWCWIEYTLTSSNKCTRRHRKKNNNRNDNTKHKTQSKAQTKNFKMKKKNKKWKAEQKSSWKT